LKEGWPEGLKLGSNPRGLPSVNFHKENAHVSGNHATYNHTLASMSEKETSLVDPATKHTLDERRAMTDDSLELASHGLKKEFTRRVENAKKEKNERYEALGDFMFAYNEAMKAAWEDALPGLQEELQKSFSVLNKLENRDGSFTEYTVEVSVPEEKLLFGLQEYETKGYYYQGENLLKEVQKLVADENAAEDPVIPVNITVMRTDKSSDYPEAEYARQYTVNCTSDLNDARSQLAEASNPYYEAVEALKHAEQELKELPEQLEEIRMMAIAQRVQDAGGAGLMDKLLDAVAAVQNGQKVEALALKAAVDEESEG